MVKCGRCGEDARDTIQCSSCSTRFDFPCSGVTEAGYRKLGAERQAAWKCSTCKAKGIASSPGFSKEDSGSPSAVTLEQVMQELVKIKLTMASISNTVAGIDAIKSDIGDLKHSMGDFSSKLLGLEERVQVIEKSQTEVLQLKDRIASLENDLNEKSQWARLNNVEIKGVPLKDKENLFDIVTKIGAKIMYPITKQNVNFLARVPSREDQVKPIIVSFLNRYVKEDFVAAARAFKKLTLADIDIPGTTSVYVNDHLTVQNKILLKKAKELKKDKDFDFVWVKNCKIFARKNQESKVILIKNEKDLLKMQ